MANYIYAFDSGVYDTTKMGSPAPINAGMNSTGRGGSFPLSAANNSFVLLSAGKINHTQVEGVLFTYNSAASSYPPLPAEDGGRFNLISPGDPAHPDKKASAVVSLTSTGTYLSGSFMRLETVAGSLSTFIGVASGVALDNTGSTDIAGSVFYSTTGGTSRAVLDDLAAIMNNSVHGNFDAAVHHRGHELTITQLSGGASGNSVPFVSGGEQSTPPNVIMIDKSGADQTRTFNGGANEQQDMTVIAAAGGTNGYDGSTVAVVTSTGLTVTYKLIHGTSELPVISGFNLATGPNMRRQVLMGYR